MSLLYYFIITIFLNDSNVILLLILLFLFIIQLFTVIYFGIFQGLVALAAVACSVAYISYT